MRQVDLNGRPDEHRTDASKETLFLLSNQDKSGKLIHDNHDMETSQYDQGKTTKKISNATFRTAGVHLKAKQYLQRRYSKSQSIVQSNESIISSKESYGMNTIATSSEKSNSDIIISSRDQECEDRHEMSTPPSSQSKTSIQQLMPMGLILHDDLLHKYSYFYFDDCERDCTEEENSVNENNDNSVVSQAETMSTTRQLRYSFYSPPKHILTRNWLSEPTASFNDSFGKYGKLPVPTKPYVVEGSGSKFFYTHRPSPSLSASISVHKLPAQQFKHGGDLETQLKPQIKVVYHEYLKHSSFTELFEDNEYCLPFQNSKSNNSQVIQELVSLPLRENHVLVKIQASTVTAEDCLLRCGRKSDNCNHLVFPITPGYDIIGHIVSIDTPKGCTYNHDFAVGDRVAALVQTGGNARYISVPISSLVRVPRHLDSTQAVAMVLIYSAAYQMLKEVTPIQDGFFSLLGKKILLILGCTILKENCTYDKGNAGGVIDDVGLALINMCQKANAELIYVVAPPNRHCFIQTVLHAIPLNCNKIDDWMDSVENKIDYVFDGVCEYGLQAAYGTVKKHSRSTEDDRSANNSNKSISNVGTGRIICYGQLSMIREVKYSKNNKVASWRKILNRSNVHQAWAKSSTMEDGHVSIKFMNLWDSFQKDPCTYKSDLMYLFQLILLNKLEPIISKRISLHEVENEQRRKIVGDNSFGGGIVICLPWKSNTIMQ